MYALFKNVNAYVSKSFCRKACQHHSILPKLETDKLVMLGTSFQTAFR